MRRLRAIGAVFATPAGLDAEQTGTLHIFTAPMFEMHRPALRNQIEKRLMIQRVQLVKSHRVTAMLNRKSKIKNQNQFTHFPPSEVRIGSSSIMNCVLPIAPIMCVPVALCHFFDMLSPVWQPQLLT